MRINKWIIIIIKWRKVVMKVFKTGFLKLLHLEETNDDTI